MTGDFGKTFRKGFRNEAEYAAVPHKPPQICEFFCVFAAKYAAFPHKPPQIYKSFNVFEAEYAAAPHILPQIPAPGKKTAPKGTVFEVSVFCVNRNID